MRLPRKPGAVIVMLIFVPTGIFFFLNGLRRSSLARAPVVVKRFFLYAQPFLCCFFLCVLQVTRTVEPAWRFFAERASSFVNFGKASELMLVVEGTTVVGVPPPPPPPPPPPAAGAETLTNAVAGSEGTPAATARYWNASVPVVPGCGP